MLANWVQETTATTGTGTINLGGAVAGFIKFEDTFSTGDTVYYSIKDGTNREVGIGTLTAGTPWTLARTTVLENLVSGTFNNTSPTAITLSGSAVVGVAAQDAAILQPDTPDNLTAGFSATCYSAGTKSSGTYTPDQDNGNLQYATNGGAHTLAPPTDNCTIIILYTNNASAGAITTSGFTLVDGDAFSLDNGYEFMCYLTKLNNGTDFSVLTVKALQ
jgi:hypothetical protein